MSHTQIEAIELPNNLVEEAGAILQQNVCEASDITTLQIIKWQMAKVYSRALKVAAESEYNYKITREQEYISLLSKTKEKKTQKQLYWEASIIAESKYWWYREALATSRWIKAMMDAIHAFCIDFYTKEKATVDAMMTTDW